MTIRVPEINVVVLSGRVTRDAEIFFTQGGTAKCSIRIACNRRVKDAKSGEWKDDTFFIDVVAWKELAERSKEKAKKGAALVVEGRLSGREYDDKTGAKRVVFEVIANRLQFLTVGGASEGSGGSSAGSAAERTAGKKSVDTETGDLEEVPF